MPCVFKRAANLLGRSTLQTSLRNLKLKYAPKAQKDKRTNVRFGELLLSEWPQPQQAAAGGSTSNPVMHPAVLVVKPVGKSSAERNAERAYMREAAAHAKTKLDRDSARLIAGREGAARAEFELQAAEAKRLSKLVKRLQADLDG
eukprot:4064352-Pleurochrysis_carterae.AAC.1